MLRLTTALIVILAVANTSAPAGAFDQTTAEKVFQSECSTCHPVDRALKKTKDRAGWEKSVERMKGYAGGLITDDEAGLIVEYLARVRGPQN